MVSVSKGALEARMLEYFRMVEQTREELVVTSDGVPVLRIVPFKQRASVDEVFAPLRGKLTWSGDLDESHTAQWEIS
jgi:antitoxin (DNA-binding transcriptional repressor) of toxin-antitoxin stability system